MTVATAIGWILGLALLTGAALALLRARRWAAGRPARVAWLAGLLRLPRSYFVDLHHIVARDTYAAHMHVAAAGGFVGAVLLVLVIHLLGIESRILAWVLLALLALMASGAFFVLKRRLGGRPARLSGGGFDRLPYSLLAFAFGFILLTLPDAGLVAPYGWTSPLGLAGLALASWGAAEMLAGMPVGPMKHAFAGALHLACHPRFERLGAERPVVGLVPADLEADKLGVETPADFAWNRLLSFDACVQCGRCEVACPAFAAGQPLNPKKLIQDLVRAMDGRGSDAGYAGSPYPGREIGKAHGAPDAALIGEGAMIHPDTLWSCTTCRACVQECPMMIEHVDAIVDLRRFQVLERGALSGKAPETIQELRQVDTQSGRALSARLDWAADLALPVLGEGESCDLLLWLGEGAFDLRNQRTLRALVRLLRAAEADFAVLGAEELDTGDLARRLGDDATFQGLARRNIEALDKRDFKRIVTADPHVFNSLRNDYPAMGGRYEVLHHTQLLQELVAAGRLAPAKREGGAAITYHDPCYLGRYNGETAAPRALLDAIGVERREMARSGMRSMCCGGGGGAPLTDIPGEARIPDLRMAQAAETGAGIVAVACPNCAVMLEGVIGDRPEVRDVAELLLEAVEGSA
jgi:Fe-S oxidoreductase